MGCRWHRGAVAMRSCPPPCPGVTPLREACQSWRRIPRGPRRAGSQAACPPHSTACPTAPASAAPTESGGQPHTLGAATSPAPQPSPLCSDTTEGAPHPQGGRRVPRRAASPCPSAHQAPGTRGSGKGVSPLTNHRDGGAAPCSPLCYRGTRQLDWSPHGPGWSPCPRQPPLNPCRPLPPLRGQLPVQDAGTRLFPSPNTWVPLIPAPHAPLQPGGFCSPPVCSPPCPNPRHTPT